MAKYDDVIASLEGTAKATFPNLDIQPNTVEHDVFLRAPALLVDSEDRVKQFITRTSTPSGFVALYNDESFLSNDLPLIFGVSTRAEAMSILAVQAELFASNYGVVRDGGKVATGFETLKFSSGAAVTVIAGTVVYNKGSNPARYVVSQTFNGSPVLVGGTYQVSVPIEAESVGLTGNMAAGNVVNIQGAISGLISVNNDTDITGGEDVESDVSLLERVITKQQGTSIDTLGGVRNVVLNAGAFDAQVFRVGDIVTRNRPGPDVLVIYENVTPTTDLFTFESTHLAGYVTSVQPLGSDVTQMSIVGHPSCQFLLVKDTSVNERSVRALDRVIFYGTDVPVVGESVQFSYPALAGITTYQELFAAPNPELFFDVLVKTAIRVDVAISLNVVLFGGVDPTGLIPTINSTILNLVNNLKMGVELSQSDVIGAVEAIPGVNRVNLPMNFFGLAGESGRVVENVITPDLTQYLRLASSNLVLTVV